MPDDETVPAGEGAGTGQPAPEPKAGPTPTAGGRNDGGQGEPDPTVNRDAVWGEAKKHYEPQLKKSQQDLADLRKRLAKYETQAKTAEQLHTELESTRGTLDKHHNVVREYAESKVESLPEHLRDILKTSAGDDPLKALELLPKFEDLARRTQLKTVGGNQNANGLPQIDFSGILAASNAGDTKPLRDAIEKHGQQVYERGLREYLVTKR